MLGLYPGFILSVNTVVVTSVILRFSVAAARGTAALFFLLLAAVFAGGSAGSSWHCMDSRCNTDGSGTPDDVPPGGSLRESLADRLLFLSPQRTIAHCPYSL